MNIDFEDAMIGATLSPTAMVRRKASRISAASGDVKSREDLRYLCRAIDQAANELAEVATHNVDVASRAGFLPTRYLGIDSEPQAAGGIAAGVALTVNSNPTVSVRIVGFRTDSTFASDFQINNIRVATIDLVVGDTACPATMFTAGIMLPPTSAPILPAGAAAGTAVTNISGAARRFRGGFPIIKLTNPEC